MRDHAGWTRGRGFGQEVLTFGPNRSVHRNDVERELATPFDCVAAQLPRLGESVAEPRYEADALRLAVIATSARSSICSFRCHVPRRALTGRRAWGMRSFFRRRRR